MGNRNQVTQLRKWRGLCSHGGSRYSTVGNEDAPELGVRPGLRQAAGEVEEDSQTFLDQQVQVERGEGG